MAIIKKIKETPTAQLDDQGLSLMAEKGGNMVRVSNTAISELVETKVTGAMLGVLYVKDGELYIVEEDDE